ncbi:MAG: hypothetical protein ACREQK_05055 [Candidatus Binatia bacterium]
MDRYSIHCFCSCKAIHRVAAGVEVANVPSERMNIGSLYQGKIPAPILALIRSIRCPVTGEPQAGMRRFYLFREVS